MGNKQSNLPERDPDHPEPRSRDEAAHLKLSRTPMVPMPKRQSRWEENKFDRAKRAQSLRLPKIGTNTDTHIDPTLLSAMHEPAPSPKHRALSDDDDALTALLMKDYRENSQNMNNEKEENTKKKDDLTKKKKKIYKWTTPGQQARVISGDHNGAKVKIMEVLSEFKALVRSV